jgi:hypothetical protein
MGCFSAPKCEERRSPRYTTGQRVASRDSFKLLANKPVELPDPRTIEGGRGRSAFSGPLVGRNGEVEARTNYFSADDGKRAGWRSLRRATSFGGRPQPLPLPAGEEAPARARGIALPAPEDAVTRSSRARTFKLEDGPAGSWSSRRGRVAPVGGLPLPPPKLLPNLDAFEFREIQLATDDFAERLCLERSSLGAVFSARLKDATDSFDSEIDTAVLRLPENATQVRTPTNNPPSLSLSHATETEISSHLGFFRFCVL